MVRIIILRREYTSRKELLAYSLLSILILIALLSAIICALGIDLIKFYMSLALPLVNYSAFLRMLSFLTPILLCAIGSVIAYRAALWNIGQEGQFIIGAIAILGFSHFILPTLPKALAILMLIIVSGFCGGFWSAICGFLRSYFYANEAVTTLMMYYISISILWYISYEIWKDPEMYGFPYTYEIPEPYKLTYIPYLNINLAIVIALIMVAIYYVIINKTYLGLACKVLAEGEKATKYAGLNLNKYITLIMFLSGFTCGIAGAVVLASLPPYRLFPKYFFGYGFSGLVAAWLSGLNVLLTIPASILLAILHTAIGTLQIELKLSIWTIQILQGIILIAALILIFLSKYRIKVIPK